ncbi:uncharacterized protein LOC100368683 [Saccoglossus kowalevskii]|uniref:Caltractin-like n=1 Tax=Saccoglossus kowalevskii TaxID=10224 RepID=A0ABM0GTS3_SACKO|nr:PREDICTED: caltractin-like [Saccoglossus kowalevskii]
MPKKKKTGKKKSKSKRVVTEPPRPVDPIPPLPPLPPQPSYGESIRDILMGSKVTVTEKEYLGVKISSKILDELTPQEIRDLKTVFDAFSNRRRQIDAISLQRAMRALGFKITRSDAREMIRDVDVDRTGMIEFNEFLEFVIQHQGSAQDIHDEIKQGFQMFDFDGTGQLTLDNLKLACKETGVKFTEQELKDMIEEADTNGDNQVDEEDFINVMLKTNLF